jgi:hypothetical protein
MLGRGGAGAGPSAPGSPGLRPPTFRVPGASVAARSAEAAAVGAGASGTSGARAGAGAAQAAAQGAGEGATARGGRAQRDVEVDDEGFQTVRGSAWRRGRAAAANDASIDAAGSQGQGATADSRADGHTGDADARATQGAAHAEAGEAPPTAEDLRQAWMEEVSVVRRLRQQGLASEHPAMEAACAARDAAETQWREAKDPAPPAVRLSRAQAKYDRAVAAQGDSRKAILELERAHKLRLAELQAKLDEDTEKVRLRRAQLAAVQDELASDGDGAKVRARQGRAVQKVHATLSGTVAPTISALVDQLDSSTPAWAMLNGLLGALSSSQSLLEEAITPPHPAQRFDIGDGEQDERDDGTDGRHGHDSESEWSESHELRDGGGPRAWMGDQSMQCDETGPGDADAGDVARGSNCASGTDHWWGTSYSDWQQGIRWQSCGHGKWSRARSSWADSWEDEQLRDDEETAQPAAARRRLEPSPATCAPPGGHANAAATDTGGGADDGRRQQQHQGDRLQLIIEAAIAAGVQPVTSTGDDLQVLDANQLAAWAAENLPEGDPRR